MSSAMKMMKIHQVYGNHLHPCTLNDHVIGKSADVTCSVSQGGLRNQWKDAELSRFADNLMMLMADQSDQWHSRLNDGFDI